MKLRTEAEWHLVVTGNQTWDLRLRRRAPLHPPPLPRCWSEFKASLVRFSVRMPPANFSRNWRKAAKSPTRPKPPGWRSTPQTSSTPRSTTRPSWTSCRSFRASRRRTSLPSWTGSKTCKTCSTKASKTWPKFWGIPETPKTCSRAFTRTSVPRTINSVPTPRRRPRGRGSNPGNRSLLQFPNEWNQTLNPKVKFL